MKIKTQDFELRKGEMLALLSQNYIRRKWWILLLLAAILPWAWQMMGRPPLELLIAAVVIFVVWIPAELAKHVFLPKNKRLYLKRRHEFDDDWIFTYVSDDSIGKMKWSGVASASKLGKHFLIYISKKQFIVIPFRAFESNDDLSDFGEFLSARKLL